MAAAILISVTFFRRTGWFQVEPPGHAACIPFGLMTIQHPPNDEMPSPTPPDDPDETPIDTPDEPEQRAPGPDQPPMGAPRDEPDPELA